MRRLMLPILFSFGALWAIHPLPGYAEHKASGADTPSSTYRVLDIPWSVASYMYFKTTVLHNEQELLEFINKIKAQEVEAADGKMYLWEPETKERFITGLETAEIEFESETLVLLRHSEGSGMISVSLDPPARTGAVLKYRMHRHVPEIFTHDRAYYCYAFVVSKEIQTLLVVTPDDQPIYTVPLGRERSSETQ